MILATHFIIGAAIGSQIGNPTASFFINLSLHYLLDMIPHWDYLEKIPKKDIPKIAIDFVVGVLLLIPLYYIIPEMVNFRSFVWGAIAGVLPDAVQGLYYLSRSRILGFHQRFHHFFHHQKNQPFFKGFAIQLVLIVISIIFSFFS